MKLLIIFILGILSFIYANTDDKSNTNVSDDINNNQYEHEENIFENLNNQPQQEEQPYQQEENEINDDEDNTQSSSISMLQEQVISSLNNVYGHIGFFGKSNVLNKNIHERYGVFSASAGLKYNFYNKVDINLGIYGMTSIYNGSNKYTNSKFIVNNAFLKYKDEYVDSMLFELKAGRYKGDRDWIKHYVQGVSVDANYSWISVWVDWVNDQALATREYLHDFNIFDERYNKEWLIATGFDVKLFGVNISPYYYLLNNNFWSGGGKLQADFSFNDNWQTNTTLQYAYLKSNTNGIYGQDSTNIGKKKSSILWIDEAITYRNNVFKTIFGLGYINIWGAAFELAKVGNMSRFETNNTNEIKIIEPGDLYNDSNSTNMFNAKTSTIYGFAGFKIDKFSTRILGRYSSGDGISQQLYSLGGRYNVIEGLYIGGIAAYMTQNRENRSFAKGYIEFSI